VSSTTGRSILGSWPAIYYQQMTERGATRLKACCVVAGHPAERAWTVPNRGAPYVVCDNYGNTVTPAKAKRIVAERWCGSCRCCARR
jgi:hypothetical protein